MNGRQVAIAVLAVIVMFGPYAWVQALAGAGALLLAWREWRVRDAAGRWRLAAFVAGLLALLYIGGVILLWLIWPT